MKNIFLFSITITLLVGCGNNQPKSMSEFAWLNGNWRGVQGDYTYLEWWQNESDKTMVGQGRGLIGEDTVFAETLKIEKIENSFFYIATVPENKGPVLFKATDVSPTKLVFENFDHDFPQVIKYELTADKLHVTLEGKRKGQNAREEIYYEKEK